ncbi:arogenate dehydratase 2-like [Cicer arietinum]|uniref:arogenate dehydratase 2-like n=1 Tax=Cicer arietinum TaxID=3827 RepID=UPI003CC50596
MAKHGVKLEKLKRVLSHPQALAQCENTLAGLGLVREAVDDTAGAAKNVALHELQDAGVVARYLLETFRFGSMCQCVLNYMVDNLCLSWIW